MKCSEKTCSSAILSTTDPTWIDLGLNSGRRDGKPASNHLSYGTAKSVLIWALLIFYDINKETFVGIVRQVKVPVAIET
jgi:hypothetical protein